MKRICFLILILFLFVGNSEAEDDLSIRVLFLDSNEALPSGTLHYVGKVEGSLLINGLDFKGIMEVWEFNGRLYMINNIPLEEYVKGVVSAESGKGWPLEAYKIQAVIARTYAVYHMKKREKLSFHVTSTVMHQVYRNGPYREEIIKAVEETKGQILVYMGEPIEALYHSTSSAFTEAPEEVFGHTYPYIKPVKVTASMSPYQKWVRRISLKDVEKSTGISDIQEVVILSRSSTGRVRDIGFRTPSGLKKIRATELRRLLGWQTLPSTAFELSRDEGYIVFLGSGYGHGVGLSQWSSLDMVLQGRTYKEVLSYFYPGTEIAIVKMN